MSLGAPEIIIILFVVLLLFGAKKLQLKHVQIPLSDLNSRNIMLITSEVRFSLSQCNWYV